jgi:hypothetical protein
MVASKESGDRGAANAVPATRRADVADPKVRFVHVVPGAPNVTLQRHRRNRQPANAW